MHLPPHSSSSAAIQGHSESSNILLKSQCKQYYFVEVNISLKSPNHEDNQTSKICGHRIAVVMQMRKPEGPKRHTIQETIWDDEADYPGREKVRSSTVPCRF